MSAKYDLLATSKISDFDAVDQLSVRTKKGYRWPKCIVIGVVIGILFTVALMLIAVIVVEVLKHESNSSSPPSTKQCPTGRPAIMVPCSDNDYNPAQCINEANCCWYGTQCVLSNYTATCSKTNNEMFTCLPEYDNWNDTYATSECNKRGCCWNKLADPIIKCYYPSEYGYTTAPNSLKDTVNGKTVTINRRSPQPSMYSNDIRTLSVQVTYETSNILRLKVCTVYLLLVIIVVQC